MTYTVLDTFCNLFFSSGIAYKKDNMLQTGVPLSSDYSEHLSGNGRLSVSTTDTRFSLVEIQFGEFPKNTPLVAFMRGRTKYVALFLRHSPAYPSENPVHNIPKLFQHQTQYF